MATMRKKAVLLGCGSFNPITVMHCRMLEVAKNHLKARDDFEILGGILSPVNDAYGKKGLLSAEHRCTMCKLALKSSDWIQLDTWEAEQPAYMPTLQVIEHFEAALNGGKVQDEASLKGATWAGQRFTLKSGSSTRLATPGHPDWINVMLVCGADLMESFATPNVWLPEDIEAIVSRGIVVKARAGSDSSKFVYTSDDLWRLRDSIYLVDEPVYDCVSSTRLRRAISRGHSVRHLINAEVEAYIQQARLYA